MKDKKKFSNAPQKRCTCFHKKHRMKRWARITASKTSMIKKISNGYS
jgi:hypothetical protein